MRQRCLENWRKWIIDMVDKRQALEATFGNMTKKDIVRDAGVNMRWPLRMTNDHWDISIQEDVDIKFLDLDIGLFLRPFFVLNPLVRLTDGALWHFQKLCNMQQIPGPDDFHPQFRASERTNKLTETYSLLHSTFITGDQETYFISKELNIRGHHTDPVTCF